jgi:enamine deaminase RidA (YjgF/YER057c/UK114 family)
VVDPPALAPPRGYSNGIAFPVAAGSRVLFVAGQVGWDEQAQMVGRSLAVQFDRALANVLAVVEAAGGGPASIGRMVIYVRDAGEYSRARRDIGVSYRKRMGRHYPAMTLVEVSRLLERGARVEIEATAVI